MNIKSKQQYFYMQKKFESLLLEVCPELAHRPGIYFYTRYEENEKDCYVGKSRDCLNRCISHHLGRKQRIDGSLQKRGYYDAENNQLGWKLNVLYFPENQLDEKESFYIDQYTKAGYVMYNIESGGTVGKTMIAERLAPKGYYEGIARGEQKTREMVKNFFDKYLDYSIKGKPNKIKERKMAEFGFFLSDAAKNTKKSDSLDKNDTKGDS